jgi:hypothetical protein
MDGFGGEALSSIRYSKSGRDFHGFRAIEADPMDGRRS